MKLASTNTILITRLSNVSAKPTSNMRFCPDTKTFLVICQESHGLKMKQFNIFLLLWALLSAQSLGLSDSSAQSTRLIFMPSQVSRDNQQHQLLTTDLSNVEFENFPIKNDVESQYSSVDTKQHSVCQLVQVVHLLHHPGCQSKAIASFACSGSCQSYVQVSN